jgi:hypothetical protein
LPPLESKALLALEKYFQKKDGEGVDLGVSRSTISVAKLSVAEMARKADI